MPDIYINSGATTPTTPYNSSWNTAAQLLVTASGIDAAGDTYYISNKHNEVPSTNQTIALAGTNTNPNKLICVDDSVFPATTPVTIPSGTIAPTGASSISIQGSGYFWGLKFLAGTGSGSNSSINIGTSDNSNIVIENCFLSLVNTSANGRIAIGSSSASTEANIVFRNVTIRFSNTGQGFSILGIGRFTMIGGGFDPASTLLNNLITAGVNNQIYCEFRGVDLTRLATGGSLAISPINSVGELRFINCKLPPGWTGVPVTTITNSGMRVSLYNCDNESTNYRLWIVTSAGSIRENTAIVKSSGASDGTTAISWRLLSNSSANEAINQLVSDPIAVWIDTTGASKTVSLDFLHDSLTSLNDSEIWADVEYLGSSTEPLGSYLADRRSTLMSTTTEHPTSSTTWTTTGLTNPNKQKLELTFTNNMKGFIYLRVYLAKPSYTIYVDPKPTVT